MLEVWWRFERLIVIVVDTFSVFVYTVFIYLYAVMLLRQKFKNSKFTFPWIFMIYFPVLYLLHWTTLRHECPDELKDCNSVIVQKTILSKSLSEIDVLVYAAMTPNRAWAPRWTTNSLILLEAVPGRKSILWLLLSTLFFSFQHTREYKKNLIFPLFLHNLHRNFIIPRLHTFLTKT